jgi:hypothetical protein
LWRATLPSSFGARRRRLASEQQLENFPRGSDDLLEECSDTSFRQKARWRWIVEYDELSEECSQ